MIIYRLHNSINGKSYIGQTIQALMDRVYRHRSKISKTAISLAIAKYGFDYFNISILQECQTQDELNVAEEYWIKYLNTLAPNGYNLKEGGGSKGKATAETRLKMSIAHKGKTVTEEHRQRTSHFFKGRVPSEKHLAKIAEARANWSEEKRKEINGKIRLAKQGIHPSEASKKKMSFKKLGTKHNAKLTWETVCLIRLVGDVSKAKELSLEYGVHPASIRNILRYKTWKLEVTV